MTAALIHLWAAPEHLREWWGYGAFFLATALGQGLFGAVLLLHGRLRWRRSLFLLGSFGNLAIIALYVFTRTVGVPLLGPNAWEPEGTEPLGLTATALELALVVALGALARDRDLLGGRRGMAVFGLALVLASLAYGVLLPFHRDGPPDHHADHHAALEPKSSGRLEPPEGRFARYREEALSGGGLSDGADRQEAIGLVRKSDLAVADGREKDEGRSNG